MTSSIGSKEKVKQVLGNLECQIKYGEWEAISGSCPKVLNADLERAGNWT